MLLICLKNNTTNCLFTAFLLRMGIHFIKASLSRPNLSFLEFSKQNCNSFLLMILLDSFSRNNHNNLPINCSFA